MNFVSVDQCLYFCNLQHAGKLLSLTRKREYIETRHTIRILQVYLHRSVGIDAYPRDLSIAKQSGNSPIHTFECETTFSTAKIDSASQIGKSAIPVLYGSGTSGEFATRADVACVLLVPKQVSIGPCE